MKELIVYNHDGKEVGKVTLKEKFWGTEVDSHVLHLALKRQLAGKRAGTHDTKTRDEVSGTGKKPWKQKGTGRARSGSVRSPLWRHGGVIFGPHPRKHGFDLPKQVRRLALQGALQNLVKDQKLMVLEDLKIPEAKTKHAFRVFGNLKAEKALLLLSDRDEKFEKACRNLPNVKLLSLAALNVHDLLRFKKVIATKSAIKALEEVLA